jgi:hypothetical protein
MFEESHHLAQHLHELVRMGAGLRYLVRSLFEFDPDFGGVQEWMYFPAEYDGRRYIRGWRIHLSRLSR